jgi:FKBP-type peptidyl-prolyl cis-trans isomerase FkpA
MNKLPRHTFRTSSAWAACVLGFAAGFAAGIACAHTPEAASAPAAAAEKGAVVTSSGLVFRALQEGMGESPAAADTVRVHYRGRFMDGREFDSS